MHAASTDRPPLPPGPFLVVGLARSGVAVARALVARGHEVAGVDERPLDERRRRELEGVELHTGDGVELLDRIATVVKSPGVPQEAEVVQTARRRGIRVVGELEIGWRLLANPFVAVTGSNGKTTTVELIGHVHRQAGLPVAVAGNVGTALSSLVGSLDAAATVVCEASSFQLEDTERFAPDAAVLLNLAPDHLDRHGTFEAYRTAKLRIFANQPPEALAVLAAGLDAGPLRAREIRFGGGGDLAERDGALWWRGVRLMRADEIRLRGAHNRENAMAAAAVCLARGVEAEAVREGLATFAGVAHRLEEVAVRDGVAWVNDSKATNVDAALVALRSFAGGVHAILGGQGKGQDFAPLAPVVAERCRAVYLIGEDAPALGAALRPTGVPMHDCGDLERAVAAARAAARPNEAVLLSPACASFDQFRDFEERGDRFRELARARA